LFFNSVGKHEDRQSECKYQDDNGDSAKPVYKSYKSEIKPVEINGNPFCVYEFHLQRFVFHPYPVYQSRDEKKGDGQRDQKIDDYDCRKILQVKADFFVQEENDGQSADTREGSGENRKKILVVMAPYVMIRHDDGVVYDKA
jgi:hypothetical protein